jgi:repressor LexA
MNRIAQLIVDLRTLKGWNQRELGERLGVTQATVSRWEGGSKPDLEYLLALAALAGMPLESWLRQRTISPNVNVSGVKVVGAVQAGAWLEALEWPADEQYGIDVPEDSRFRGFTKKALRVQGPSMNKLYPEGSYVIVVPYIELEMQPEDGDKVVCQRTRADGLVEATIKQYVLSGGKPYLWPRSTDPEHQTPLLLTPESDGEKVQITAKVIGAYIPE